MSITQLNPYLIFDGTSAQAIQLYERALGAKTESLQHFGDVPGTPSDSPSKDRIIHALLRIGAGVVMVSDSRPGEPMPVKSNVHICLAFDDEAEMTQKFEALAEGGEVEMALQDTFWGAKFGTLTDAHGVGWMFNCDKKKG
ncbi:MAG: glyoxalase/bleomycin resistance/extradiol dioxygenase family protein [Minicystis sp.]